jgi:pyruvate kinase
VPDAHLPVERREGAIVEDRRHETHVLDHGQVLAVARGDAGRLLSTMLEGEDAQIAEVSDRLARGVDAEDATFLSGTTVVGEIPVREVTGR